MRASLMNIAVLFVSLCSLLLPVDLPAQGLEEGSASTLVIYFSRTGNTEIMAEEITSRYQADLKNIKADEYSANFKGSLKANRDAWNEKRISVINPEIIDLTQYQLIFLGSPIWWYRPAVPLWTFVEKNDLDGKSIVLFNTYNSRFKKEHIDEFEQLVTQKGGVFVDHISVRRGRVFNQIDKKELIRQVQQLLLDRENNWIELVGTGAAN
jgi:flavodoxin